MTRPDLLITKKEFEALPEYSASIPTGTTPGKRWKCSCNDGKWKIGEYGEIFGANSEQIKINWYNPIIADVPRQMGVYVEELINRLRGTYNMPVNDGAGLLDGSNIHTSLLPSTRINIESAYVIETLYAALKIYADTITGVVAQTAIQDVSDQADRVAEEWYQEQLEVKRAGKSV